jgi:hypothetical protein
MSKDEMLSENAIKMISDAKSLVPRLDHYIRLADLNPNKSEKLLTFFESALSVVEGLGSKLIRENAANKVDILVQAIYLNKDQSSKLIDKPQELAKLDLNAAKTEAALKGFTLPLSAGSQLFELDSKKLERNEILAAVQSVKQTVLEFANKGIAANEYPDTICKSAIQKLSTESNISQEKLNQFKEFIEQGIKVQKPSKLSSQENKLLEEAVSKSVDQITNKFNKASKEVQIELILDSVLAKTKENNIRFGKAASAKIKSSLSPALAEASIDDLIKNKDAIIKNIYDDISKNKTFKSGGYNIFKTAHSVITGNYSVPTNQLDKIKKTFKGSYADKIIADKENQDLTKQNR